MEGVVRFKYRAIVIGASSGGLKALRTILSVLPADFPLSVIIVVHRHPDSDGYLEESLNNRCGLTVKQADEREKIRSGVVYIGPPNYHLLIEDARIFSLSLEEAVNYARPSIDVLFESAADVYGLELIGVILSGYNDDGVRGLQRIKRRGGLTVVQAPETAEAESMPRGAIATVEPDHVLPLKEIGPFLNSLVIKPALMCDDRGFSKS